MFAIDPRARERLQLKLDPMARTGNTQTPAGRRQLLASAVAAIEQERAAWMYVGSQTRGPRRRTRRSATSTG